MLRNCPNHDILKHIQVNTFYHWLTNGGKDKLDHLNGDSFLSETTTKYHNLLDNLVANHYEKKSERATSSKAVGVIEVDKVKTLNAKIDFLMQTMKIFCVNQVQHTSIICEDCREGHSFNQCAHSVESIQCVSNTRKPQNKPDSNSYNPGWRQHPNFSWNNNQEQGSTPRFQQVFKKLHINILFTESLEQMPSYVKFMKDIFSKKRCLGDYEIVALIEEYSAIIQNKLPPKLKDPESFTIPCTIGTYFSGRALCNLRASINLMPYSIYRTLGLGEAKPTSITLQLADRSLTYPSEVIEDILVKVDKFIFLADFVVFDMEADSKIPIILGRPFLATSRTLIDVQKGELIMRVQDQQITLNVFKPMKFSNESDECFSISIFDNLAGKEAITERPLDPLECALFDLANEENKEDLEAVKALDASKFFKPKGVESLERTTPSKVLKPSIEEPPTLELKLLPNHLRYAYLEESDTLSIIISSLLSNVQEENQRRLNPIMKEVVKKEIIKWLDAGIIYSISDSSWVSPVQCVRKRGGITMIPNMHNEFIPTRTVTGWRDCMDYRKLNKATRKDHFPLPLIDQMLDKLVGKNFYYFLDRYSGYNQIAIASEDQEKTTFTCPYGTFAFQRMLFGLCNAPAKFQRYMMAIFTDMIENFLKVFIDDFSVYGNSFDECLNNLSLILKRCEDTNLIFVKYQNPVQFARKRYRKGTDNQIVDNLSRLESLAKTDEPNLINDNFPDEQLLATVTTDVPWYADIVNYLTCEIIPLDLSAQQKKKFWFDTRRYFWDEPFLFKQCFDNILRSCVLEGDRTAAKILQFGFYWPNLFKDAHSFVTNCDRCQRIANISRRHEMPLNTILEVELFDVWGINFMGPYVPSFGYRYILVAVDYVSQYIKTTAVPSNDSKVVVNFIKKNIFT
ncbi:DNA-directed DNA polymerase [Handroanthus impetiginosus]|uniref:DNA-directed DNA polymerase n=1 Tax=Handroanthus impetiginosus TaxID=429701 RepID=A0A2G9HKU2_9LAMI|nr:DNA-directed DNA polymerase [Handroanthus impetiginosus]